LCVFLRGIAGGFPAFGLGEWWLARDLGEGVDEALGDLAAFSFQGITGFGACLFAAGLARALVGSVGVVEVTEPLAV